MRIDDSDPDKDGMSSNVDNCPLVPNGPLLGTCLNLIGGVLVVTEATCVSSQDCEENGLCDMSQLDSNDNGIGDDCECFADCNSDTKVNLADLVMMKEEFLRDDCAVNPCYADCNGDNQVNLSDLVIMKTQFLRTDCPACP